MENDKGIEKIFLPAQEAVAKAKKDFEQLVDDLLNARNQPSIRLSKLYQNQHSSIGISEEFAIRN